VPLRAKVFGNIATLNRWASLAPRISNFFFGNQQTSSLLKKALGISQERSLPLLSGFSFRKWHQRHRKNLKIKGLPKGKVYLFCDEFTNYNEAMLGVKTVRLLLALGYEVDMPPHADSGRAQVSKGLLIDAQRLAKQNVATFRHLVTAETPLLGIEPSAILSFRDEYPRLVDPSDADEARKLGENCLMIEEFFAREMRASRIGAEHFSKAEKKILLHGHCHQKALASVTTTVEMLSLPENYYVEVIPSGCCGMAGSFGYETEHYQVSMKVGELVLFPAIRQAQTDCLISAPGTSCRHQIADGTGRQALHPVEILWEALSENLKT
jgi:Fe-S oxidoreductase